MLAWMSSGEDFFQTNFFARNDEKSMTPQVSHNFSGGDLPYPIPATSFRFHCYSTSDISKA